EGNPVLEGGEAAVVHVWRRAADLAQRRCLEGTQVALESRNATAPRVGERSAGPGDAGVVKLLVGEVRSVVARRTVALAPKHLKSDPCFGRQRIAVAVHEPIERGITRSDRADVAGEGAREIRAVDIAAERTMERIRVAAVMAEPVDHFVDAQTEFVRVLDWRQYLFLEA